MRFPHSLLQTLKSLHYSSLFLLNKTHTDISIEAKAYYCFSDLKSSPLPALTYLYIIPSLPPSPSHHHPQPPPKNARSSTATNALRPVPPPPRRLRRPHNPLLLLRQALGPVADELQHPQPASRQPGRRRADREHVPADGAAGDHVGPAAERGQRECHDGEDTGEGVA